MRKRSIITSLTLLASILALPQAGAVVAKAGATCSKAGATSIVANLKFTCVKSGKKLVWDKGILVVAKATPTASPNPAPSASSTPSASPAPSATPSPSASATPSPTASSTPTKTPTPTPSPTVQQTSYYVANDQKVVRHLVAIEGCANPLTSKAEIQVQVGDKWVSVKPINSGWYVKPNSCPVAQLGKKDSIAWADVYLDPGVTFRWYFKGEVNIRQHDNLGNGFSESDSLPVPIPAITPHPVEGGYGITWQNITQRVSDISAASWTDAQLSLARNKNLPNVGKGLTTYISTNAAKFDTKLDEVTEILNRTFTLFARIPASPNIFFVATTYEDAPSTKEALKGIYSNSQFMRNSIDSIYALDQNPLAGSPWVYTGCGGGDYARNTFTWPNTIEAQALILGVCPGGADSNGHFEAVQGMSHEYIHLIQIGLRPQTLDSFENIPCWMVEGEAEWGQTAVASSFSNYLRGQHFHPYLLTSDGRDFQQTTAREWTAQEVQSYFANAADTLKCHNVNQYAYSYSLGAATVEALSSIGGSESIFALHERLNAGETINDAFNTVYGITWDAAAPILAEVVAKKITKSWDADALTYQTRP